MTDIPSTAKKPTDRKKPAAQVEAEGGGTMEIEFGGKTYVVPASVDDAPGDFIDAVDDQKASHAIRALIGEEQWADFKSTKPKAKHYGEFVQEYFSQTGQGEPGE